MSALRRTARGARAGWRALRFRVWAARLDIELRRNGGRLILDAPHGARLDELPVIRAIPDGDGDGTLTLRIGRDVSFGMGCVIEVWARGTNTLELGADTLVGDQVRLHLNSGQIKVGRRSQLRDFVRLKSRGELALGERVVLAYSVILHCTERIDIEDMVLVGERSTVIDSDHGFDGGDDYSLDAPLKTAPVYLERNVFVGAGVIVMRGTHIGRNAVVGGGSVVARGNYAGGWLIIGSPARAHKRLPRAPTDTPGGHATET